MRIVLLLIVFIWTLSACTSSEEREKEKYARVVEEWMGKRISLPEDMTDELSGDTIDLREADFVILTYIDSLGCTGCKMRLPLWNEFIESIDDVTDADVRTLMIVHPKDENEPLFILHRDSYDGLAYFDKSDRICRENCLPDNPMYQTFLIDKSGCVIAVGNPVDYPGVGDLYRSIVSGSKTILPKTKSMVGIDRSRIHVGTLAAGNSVVRDVILSNHGNDTLYIRKVITSCDCVEVTLTEKHIEPDGKLLLGIIVKGDTAVGNFDRTIHIFFEGEDSPVVIHVYGHQSMNKT